MEWVSAYLCRSVSPSCSSHILLQVLFSTLDQLTSSQQVSHRAQSRRVVRPAFDGTVSLRTQSVRPFVQVFFISEEEDWVEVVPAAFISPGLCNSAGSSSRGVHRSDKAET